MKKNIKFSIYSFYLLFLLTFTIYIGVKPYYNMDMLPYAAILLKMEGGKTPEQIHQTTYAEAKQHLSTQHFADLSRGSDYRAEIYEDAAAFDEQLAFYIIKPLYVAGSYLSYQAGASLPFATALPSLLSFFIIGLLILWWMDKILPYPWLTLWICLFIITSEPLVEIGKISAPDAPAMMFLLIAAYLYVEKQSYWKSTIFFVLAILTRPDYIILVFFIFLISLAGKWYRKVSLSHWAGGMLLLLGAYLLPKLFLENVAWYTLFYHTFIERVAFPVSDPPVMQVSDYLQALKNNLVPRSFFARSYLLLIAFFAGTTLRQPIRHLHLDIRKWSFNQLFMLALLITMVVRFLLFPAFFDRFMAPFLLLTFFIFLRDTYPGFELIYRKYKRRSPVSI
ncbi:MAG: hypothetical protein ACLFUB_10850 [Cyclobacteriaceae bacterium]